MQKHCRRSFRTLIQRAALYACSFLFLLLTGCTLQETHEDQQIRVVLEKRDGFDADKYIAETAPGSDITFRLTPSPGWRISGCDRKDAELLLNDDGTAALTIREIKYSTVISVFAEENPYSIRYHLDPENDTIVEKTYPAKHLRINTWAGWEGLSLLSRDGSRLLCGWNTKPDGSGTHIGLGSRIRVPKDIPTDLYAEWKSFSDASDFLYETDASGRLRITGYRGNAEELVIPASIDGTEVVSLADHAFSGLACRSVILPPTLREIGLYTFKNSSVCSLTFYDSITGITDYAFEGCKNLQTIRINAVIPPVYSGTYFDTFTDKTDYLFSLKGKSKIILFSGSSTRFGYDSERIDQAFPEYDVVNMGVFAYTNALPQLDIILKSSRHGDILLHSPEFDALKRQFCTTNAIDENFFAMIESDYDLLTLLDYHDYGGLLSAFNTFQKNRTGMTPGSYLASASDYDEDHIPVSGPSYNMYGDYILYRPNAEEDTPVYDLPVSYTADSFPEDQIIEPLNEVYRKFLAKGITVYFTYAPRNAEALSEESTEDERQNLDAWLREKLCVPVISGIEESLYPGRLLFGTDNHLSTEGVAVRTERIIEDIKAAESGRKEADP